MANMMLIIISGNCMLVVSYDIYRGNCLWKFNYLSWKSCFMPLLELVKIFQIEPPQNVQRSRSRNMGHTWSSLCLTSSSFHQFGIVWLVAQNGPFFSRWSPSAIPMERIWRTIADTSGWFKYARTPLGWDQVRGGWSRATFYIDSEIQLYVSYVLNLDFCLGIDIQRYRRSVVPMGRMIYKLWMSHGI